MQVLITSEKLPNMADTHVRVDDNKYVLVTNKNFTEIAWVSPWDVPLESLKNIHAYVYSEALKNWLGAV